jgi:pyruvate formate lyase activating enzyme
MIKAPVCKIIPFSNVDGPGNRMAIFFQGCPFNCWYCHNPETINICNDCGLCVQTCPENALEMKDSRVYWVEEKCISCDQCLKTCPNLSNPKASYYTADELMPHVLEVAPFIRGITVSGGEAMMYPEFLIELFEKANKLQLDILIDSNGYRSFKDYPRLLSLIDGVMLDVKATNPSFHEILTGQKNNIVLENLQYLLSVNKLYEVRIVCLPGYDEQNRETITFVSQLIGGQCRLKLIKYRPYGVTTKGLELLGNDTLDDNLFLEYQEVAKSSGAKQVIMV